jgi:hypothetical protein
LGPHTNFVFELLCEARAANSRILSWAKRLAQLKCFAIRETHSAKKFDGKVGVGLAFLFY